MTSVVKPGKPRVGRPGIAEIKKHNPEGVRRGVAQVLRRPVRDPNTERWVLTYLPVPEGSKRPTEIRIFAQQVAPKQQGPFELARQPVPAMVPFPSTDQPQLFGLLIEKSVRKAFRPYLPSTFVRGTGGFNWGGVDVKWNELASLYAELAQATADPLFEELAAELQEIAAQTGRYRHISDDTVIRPGRPFTDSQKCKIREANRRRNGGQLRSDDRKDPFQILSEPVKSVSPGMGGPLRGDPRMAVVDHIVSIAMGGSNSYGNAQVISRHYNDLLRDKRAKRQRSS